MVKKKSQRLGKNGLEEVLGHKFFEGLDIEKLMKKQLQPLYMPEIKDCEFFDQKLV